MLYVTFVAILVVDKSGRVCRENIDCAVQYMTEHPWPCYFEENSQVTSSDLLM